MKIRNGELVFLKEDVLAKFHNLHHRVPEKVSRPFCVMIKDKKTADIYWAIPITSSSLDKYKSRAKHAPNRFRFYKVKGRECCFNVSEMLPVISEDISNKYMRGNTPLTLKTNETRELERIVSVAKTLKGLHQLSRYENIDKMLDYTLTRLKSKEKEEERPRLIIHRTSSKGMGRER